MKAKTLVVCSITNWIVQDFIDAKIADIEIIGDRGFDLPTVKPSAEVAWWMPTEHAVKLRYSDFSIPFIAPGSHWLPTVPQALTGRIIQSATVEETLSENSYFSQNDSGKLWIKPAEFKHQEFFAGLYTKEETSSFNLPPDASLQWTSTILDISEEHRFYIMDHQVITGSEYLVDNVTYYDGAISSNKGEAWDFATTAVKQLGANQPPAYTLDVAFDRISQSWVVLEGNPAFSSAIYGSDPEKVIEVLLRCANPVPEDSPWLWEPDPYLMKKYAHMRPLR
jgi:hypothetical protein